MHTPSGVSPRLHSRYHPESKSSWCFPLHAMSVSPVSLETQAKSGAVFGCAGAISHRSDQLVTISLSVSRCPCRTPACCRANIHSRWFKSPASKVDNFDIAGYLSTTRLVLKHKLALEEVNVSNLSAIAESSPSKPLRGGTQ